MFVNLNKNWKRLSWVVSFALFAPLLAIVWQSLASDQGIFNHLWQTVLPSYLINSFLLLLGVVLLSTLIAVPTAWLIACCNFPLRNLFVWSLMLPLALPSYVVAYVYTELLECAGPVQRSMINTFGSGSDSCLFEFRSISGTIFVLSLVLFPYIYLLARAAFMEQSYSLIKSSRVLGCNARQSFFRISLPLARPAIMIGITLVAMETLADFAVVKYFAISTLTTAVYDTWLGFDSLAAAARLSVLMLVIIFALITLERFSRRKQKFYQKTSGQDNQQRYQLTGFKAIAAFLACSVLLIVSFVLPFVLLAKMAIAYFSESWDPVLIEYSYNSLLLASIVSVCCLLIGVLLAYFKRLSSDKYRALPGKFSSMGYALPGTVLAIGVLIPLSAIDIGINQIFEWFGENGPGLLFSGSLFAIVFGYTVRFSAIAIGAIESSLSKVSPSLDMVSVTLGLSPLKTLVKVHLPLIRKSFFAASLLVFIESMKELPAALLLRPFGFETLATHVYQYVSDERLEEAALAAIIIVLVGLIPLIFLNRSLERTH